MFCSKSLLYYSYIHVLDAHWRNFLLNRMSQHVKSCTFDLQLEKLLDEVRKVTLEGQKESVSSQCALFVCNKWDQVPEKEVKEVQNHVIKKLKKCWPGLDPKSQIVYMSTKNAGVAQSHGIITQDFFSLMNGMRSMVLKSIEARLEMHWK